jgi:hypothetical protein
MIFMSGGTRMCEQSPVYTREDTDMAKGLLLAAINFRNVAEDEFQDWYDTEHLPERERVAGFLTAQRWIGVDDAKMAVNLYRLPEMCSMVRLTLASCA